MANGVVQYEGYNGVRGNGMKNKRSAKKAAIRKAADILARKREEKRRPDSDSGYGWGDDN